jgi:uncharacterized membrane protein
MRTGLFIVGVILLILGAVLIAVPLIPSSSSFTAYNGSTSTIPFNIYTASPLIPTSAHLSWTSPTNTSFEAWTCSNAVTSSELQNVSTQAEFNAKCGTTTVVANTSGTSGSYSFTIPGGGSLVYTAFSFGGTGSTAPSVSTTLTGTEPLAGLALVILGVILLILGVALKSKKQKAAAIAAAPASPPPTS